ncbi:MAG TPA: hypothetical protein V6C72_05960, partial [Chroococcales cyanobacterium]
GVFLKGLSVEVVTAILSVLECLIMTPLYAFIFCSASIAASCFYEQLRVRLQASDLVQALSNLPLNGNRSANQL